MLMINLLNLSSFSAHIPSDVTEWKGTKTREVLQMIKCLYELQDEEIIASTARNVVCGEEHEMTFQGTDCCRIYPADCKAFSHFLSHIKNLHRLDLSSHRIGDSGCLELLSTCNELAEVNLNGNEITDQGVKDLSEALKNKEFKLTSLKLGNNKITDVGVKNLIEALENGNCKLTSIDLDGNMITDESAKHLHEALTNKTC